MIAIKDYKAIYEYRKRRQERLDGRRLDDEWKTIKGTHVMVDDEGSISKGPENLRKLPKKPKAPVEKTVTEALRPAKTDYNYSSDDTFHQFLHKNVEELRPIYEESGMDGVEDEWFKTRINNSSNNFKVVSDDEIDKAFEDNIDRNTARMWLVEYNNDAKPKLAAQLTANDEVRNAALNVMYKNYADLCKDENREPPSYEDFLVTPIKMYRGGSGKGYEKKAAFSSYTFNKAAAERFKSDPSGHGKATDDGVVYEAEIRPIDTLGSLNTSGETEIFVPGIIAPNGRKDSRWDEDDDWEWYDPRKEVFERKKEDEPDEKQELINSIIQDAETIKIFSEKDDEVGRNIKERCVDMIQRTVKQLTSFFHASNGDGAFFSGELNSNLGERNVQYPEVEAFRERRQKRLDAADDEGRWVTTENDHKIHINEEGVPDKGNPRVIAAMTSGTKTREEIGRSRVDRVRGKIKKSLEAYKAADEKAKDAAIKYYDANEAYRKAKNRIDMVDRVYIKALDMNGIKEGDGERLKKEVEELKKKSDKDPYNRELESEYNNKKFLLAEYEDAYGEETKEFRKNFEKLEKENNDAKKELDKHLADRRAADKELKEHVDGKSVQSIKFYTPEERKAIADEVVSSKAFGSLNEEEKSAILKSIDSASDAQLSVLKKTVSNAHIMRMEDTAKPDSSSHYVENSGIMYLEEEDRKNPRVFWHEYGHYMDDYSHSKMEDEFVAFGEGTPHESKGKTFSSILGYKAKVFGKDAAADLQDMFDGVAPGEFEVFTNDEESYIGVKDKKTGAYIDFASKKSWDLQVAFDKVIDDYLNGGPDGGEVEEYKKSIGYPLDKDRPKRDDYMESYVTPKRKLEREREKYKGAEREYHKKLEEYYNEQVRVIEKHPEFNETISELYKRRGERERTIAPVTDCLCATMFGGVFSIYGCHDRDYYRTGRHAQNEWAANIHQMMFCNDKDAMALLSRLMPRTMKKVKKEYNEYLWRNLSV